MYGFWAIDFTMVYTPFRGDPMPKVTKPPSAVKSALDTTFRGEMATFRGETPTFRGEIGIGTNLAR